MERAAVAAIRSGRERIELASFEDPDIWRGVAAPGRGTRPRPRLARRAGEGSLSTSQA
jgi:hypothetical protein